MREILFKAKWINNDKWLEGYYFYNPNIDKHFIHNWLSGGLIEVDKNTLCQYTGLTDKNGNKIWENDIVKGRLWKNAKPHRLIGKVEYVHGAYKVCGVKQYSGVHDNLNGAYEIIGNIFDNPELLSTSGITGYADNGGLMPAT